ncbi:MAG: 50S ribosomal protein L25/general stress protein Ctc [Thermodesulfobacteriota bacterium]
MAQSTLNAKVRKRIGKSGAKEVRNEGNIPAVLYGKKSAPVSLAINPKELKDALKTSAGINTLLELKYTDEGKEYKKVSLLREVQVDPISSHPVHLDFQILELDEAITVEIPLVLTGRPVGVREGGVLMEKIREIEISCLPSDIPSTLEIDISHLKLGEAVHIRDLTLPNGVTVTKEADEEIASVISPRGMDLGDTTEQDEASESDEAKNKAEGSGDSKSESKN